MNGGVGLEQRYRRVLRLLPGYYRQQWEEDMVAAFLDSWLTGDPEVDAAVLTFCRPSWGEVASVAGLAARLYLGGAAAPRRYFAWGQAAAMPQPHHLQSPLILQDMHTQGLVGRVGQPGGCPAGWVTLSAGPGPGQCYRKIGTPVTITSAAVSPVFPFRPPPPPGQQAAPVQYGFSITVPAADVPALATVLPRAPRPPGPPTASAVTSATPIPTISVAGRTWILLGYASPSADGAFDVTLPSRNQALQLQRILAAAS